MVSKDYRPLLRLINIFVMGEDRSLRVANKIEAMMINDFADEEWFDEAVYALAMYSPGGDDHLYDEKDLTQALVEVRDILVGSPDQNGDEASGPSGPSSGPG